MVILGCVKMYTELYHMLAKVKDKEFRLNKAKQEELSNLKYNPPPCNFWLLQQLVFDVFIVLAAMSFRTHVLY